MPIYIIYEDGYFNTRQSVVESIWHIYERNQSDRRSQWPLRRFPILGWWFPTGGDDAEVMHGAKTTDECVHTILGKGRKWIVGPWLSRIIAARTESIPHRRKPSSGDWEPSQRPLGAPIWLISFIYMPYRFYCTLSGIKITVFIY